MPVEGRRAEQTKSGNVYEGLLRKTGDDVWSFDFLRFTGLTPIPHPIEETAARLNLLRGVVEKNLRTHAPSRQNRSDIRDKNLWAAAYHNEVALENGLPPIDLCDPSFR